MKRELIVVSAIQVSAGLAEVWFDGVGNQSRNATTDSRPFLSLILSRVPLRREG